MSSRRKLGIVVNILMVIAVLNLARHCLWVDPSADSQETGEDRRRTEVVNVVRSGGTPIVSLRVERAETPEERARGLMGRKYLARDSGMLFVLPSPQQIALWMKNTPLSLDILFVDEHDVIVKILERTEPMSEASLPSGQPVRAALEVNAGTVAKHGIKVGDRLHYRRN